MKWSRNVSASESVYKELQRQKTRARARETPRSPPPQTPSHPHIATSKLVLPSLYPLDDCSVEDTRFSERVSKVLYIHRQGNLFSNADWISHFSQRHKQKKKKTLHQLSTQKNLESGLTGWTPCRGSELVPKLATSFPAFGTTQNWQPHGLSPGLEGSRKGWLSSSIQILPPLSLSLALFFLFNLSGLHSWIAQAVKILPK